MGNYIQVEIGGKLRGLKFNQGTLIEFNTIVELNSLDATSGYALIYSALKSNCFVKREEFTDTFEQVCDWVDELSDDVIKQVLAAFQESTLYQTKLKPVSEDEKKNMKMEGHTDQTVSD